jgi:hypothetical protein
MGEKRNVYRLLVRKPEGKRPLGRPRRRWMDNIKMDLLEIGVSVVDWIYPVFVHVRGTVVSAIFILAITPFWVTIATNRCAEHVP